MATTPWVEQGKELDGALDGVSAAELAEEAELEWDQADMLLTLPLNQALQMFHDEPELCRDYRRAAKKFPSDRRQPGISPFEHLELADLPTATADALLHTAATKGWSPARIRRAALEARNRTRNPDLILCLNSEQTS